MAVTTVKIDGTKITEYLKQSGMDRTSFISADHKGQKLDPKTLRKAIAGEPIAVERAKLLADKADISAEELVLPEYVELVAEEPMHIEWVFYSDGTGDTVANTRLNPVESSEYLIKLLNQGTRPLGNNFWNRVDYRADFDPKALKHKASWAIHEDVPDRTALLDDLEALSNGLKKHNEMSKSDTGLDLLIQQVRCTEEINHTLNSLHQKGVRLFGGIGSTEEFVFEGLDEDDIPIVNYPQFKNAIFVLGPIKYKSIKVSYRRNEVFPEYEMTEEEIAELNYRLSEIAGTASEADDE